MQSNPRRASVSYIVILAFLFLFPQKTNALSTAFDLRIEEALYKVQEGVLGVRLENASKTLEVTMEAPGKALGEMSICGDRYRLATLQRKAD